MNLPSVDKLPYYPRVPKALQENLLYRKHVYEQCSAYRNQGRFQEFRQQVFIACCRDPLFYINTFCWLFEPRTAKVLPFITYEYQDHTILEIIRSIGKNDLVIEKSRDMGASWMCLTSMKWLWHFFPNFSFLLLSRKEELVYKRGDPKALFTKIEFILDHEPPWLRPRIGRSKMHLENSDNGSTIDGESTNEFAGVADRRTALLLDEFSKMDNQSTILRGTRDVTLCRIFNYTPQGSSNASYKIAHNSKFTKITLHWSKHPIKSRGLYKPNGGTPVLLDEAFWTPMRVAGYKFRSETPLNAVFGGLRSPWYDQECDRAESPKEIAQELDIDYLGSSYQFFLATDLDRIIDEDVTPPTFVGDFIYEPETLRSRGFVPHENGRFQLWGLGGCRPARGRSYVIGCDVALGMGTRGSSNSAMVISDCRTKEVVGVMVSNGIEPTMFAQLAMAVGWWFNGTDGRGARLIWEANGPGNLFTAEVLRYGYKNIYYRPKSAKNIRNQASLIPGWYTTKESKLTLLGQYRDALRNKTFVNRSRSGIEECREIVCYPNGAIGHARAINKDDPTQLNDNHGDEVIAAALCCYLCLKEADVDEPTEDRPEDIPPNCFLARKLARQAAGPDLHTSYRVAV